jgi:hypothetical protein
VRQVDAAEPARTELPGFSMVLPPGDVLEQSRLPVTGTYKLAVSSDAKFEAPYDQLDRAQLLPRGRQVVVSWMAVAHTTDEWRLYVQAIANSIGTPATIGRDESAGGRRVTLIELPSFSLGVGAAVCEDKFTVVVIWAMSRDAAQQFMGARAAVNSVQCKLTPENLRPFEAAVTLPRGFSRDATEEGQVYTSRQGEQLVVSYTGQDVQRHGPKLRDIITNLFAAAGGFSDLRLSDVATAPVAGRPESLFRFESKDMEAGYVAALYCPAFDVTFISIWTGPKPSDELALQRLRAVACPAEDGAKH